MTSITEKLSWKLGDVEYNIEYTNVKYCFLHHWPGEVLFSLL